MPGGRGNGEKDNTKRLTFRVRNGWGWPLCQPQRSQRGPLQIVRPGPDSARSRRRWPHDSSSVYPTQQGAHLLSTTPLLFYPPVSTSCLSWPAKDGTPSAMDTQCKSWIARSPGHFSAIVHSRHRCTKHCFSLGPPRAYVLEKSPPTDQPANHSTEGPFKAAHFIVLALFLPPPLVTLWLCLTSSQYPIWLREILKPSLETPNAGVTRGERGACEQLLGRLLLHCRREKQVALSRISASLLISHQCQASSEM